MRRVLVMMVKKSPLAGAVGMRSEIERVFAPAANLTAPVRTDGSAPCAAHRHVKARSRAVGRGRTV